MKITVTVEAFAGEERTTVINNIKRFVIGSVSESEVVESYRDQLTSKIVFEVPRIETASILQVERPIVGNLDDIQFPQTNQLPNGQFIA